MSGITSHLARRAVQAYDDSRVNGVSPDFDQFLSILEGFKPPAWFMPVFIGTLVAWMTVALSIRYTVGDVMATLAMVETPATEMDLPTDADADEDADEPDAPLLSKDEKAMGTEKVKPTPGERLGVKPAPITSSIRGTARHLRAQAGRFARFRGIGLYVIYNLALFHLAAFIRPISPSHYVADGAATVLVAPLMMIWTHVVISKPSSKAWFRRLPSRLAVIKVLPATTLFALAEQVALGLPERLHYRLGLNRVPLDLTTMSAAEAHQAAGVVTAKALAVFAACLFSFVMILIPAGVTLTRVQASLLPDSEETIVPIDRTFNGAVTPELVGGTGKLAILSAWRTFDWAARIRLMKLYAKILIIQLTLAIIFLTIIATETAVAASDLLPKMKKIGCSRMHPKMQG
ncbi:MAG: hypothetical protein M1838_004709 [Thelocarpon superellum]|nr:MAG: hypothetical protein M1838_004709 [Thelocarpon superellum]